MPHRPRQGRTTETIIPPAGTRTRDAALNFTQPRTQTNRTTRQNTNRKQHEMDVPVVEMLIKLRSGTYLTRMPEARAGVLKPVRTAVGRTGRGVSTLMVGRVAGARDVDSLWRMPCNYVHAITEAPNRVTTSTRSMARPLGSADAAGVRSSRDVWRLAYVCHLRGPGPHG